MDVNDLRNVMSYDADNGKLFWRERSDVSKSWNTRFANKEAFTANSLGYRRGAINKKLYMAHVIIWAIYYGEWPNGQIDHINGDRSDNRIENLRIVDNSGNQRNTKLSKTNLSGQIGVCWAARESRWRAYILGGKEQICLGYFQHKDDAIAARKIAEAKLGFHENHGRV